MTRNSPTQSSTRFIYGCWIAATAAVIAFAAMLVFWNTVPKMHASEDAIKTVDALFTAINSHDSKRMVECQMKLERYTSAGGLSQSAMFELTKCCDQAEAG